jgi:Xaa-Pro dipeptidase
MAEGTEDEDVRAARLLDAQAKAAQLFAAVEQLDLVRAGVREVEASDAIRNLAAEMFGVDRHWHKRIVRAEHTAALPAEPARPHD